MTNNFISIGQTQFLKVPAVRKTLGMPLMPKKKLEKFPKKEKTFREAVKECKAIIYA